MRIESVASPSRSTFVAIFCLSGSRESERYTRTFVSTSAVTVVKILACPAAIDRPFRDAQQLAVTPRLPGRGRVETRQALFARQPLFRPCGRDPKLVAPHAPLDVIPGLDGQLFRQCLGDTYLILTRDLGHFLTVARISGSGHLRSSAPICSACRNSSPPPAARARRSPHPSKRFFPAADACVPATCNGRAGRVRCPASSPDYSEGSSAASQDPRSAASTSFLLPFF